MGSSQAGLQNEEKINKSVLRSSQRSDSTPGTVLRAEPQPCTGPPGSPTTTRHTRFPFLLSVLKVRGV